MLPRDTRDEWDPRLMPDPRVFHFWDEGRVVGTWYGEQEGCDTCIAWDVYYLYDSDAELEDWLDTGYGVLGAREQLQASLVPLIEAGN